MRLTQLYDEFDFPLSPLESLAALNRRPKPRLRPPEAEEEEPLDVTGVRPKVDREGTGS